MINALTYMSTPINIPSTVAKAFQKGRGKKRGKDENINEINSSYETRGNRYNIHEIFILKKCHNQLVELNKTLKNNQNMIAKLKIK